MDQRIEPSVFRFRRLDLLMVFQKGLWRKLLPSNFETERFPRSALKVSLALVTEREALARAEEILEYSFKDRSLLSVALTHASIAGHRLESNERLEFLGDSVLGLVVCERLYELFPNYLEGELTKIKSAVVSRRDCAIVANRLELPDLLFLGKGMSGRAALPTSLAAAVLEALVGAIFLDGGLDETKRFILQHMEDLIDAAAESEHQNNYKSQLQQHAQKSLTVTPSYEILDEQGPDHSKCFQVCVVLNGHHFRGAWGPSKKEAEQKAAYNALVELSVLEAEDSESEFSSEPAD